MFCPICFTPIPSDTGTCVRCSWVTTAFVVRQGEIDCSEARLPPDDLIYRVMGSKDPQSFLAAGREVAESFVRGLDRSDRRLRDCPRILDFGSGCGRVLRWLIPKAPDSVWTACDIDAPAIDWVRQNLPSVTAITSETSPPLPFDDGQFDLVLGYSVFTHLPTEYQDVWLKELRRVTHPGGTLLLTVHGPSAFRGAAARSSFTAEHLDSYIEDGFFYWSNDFWKDHFPAYYQTAFHQPSYIRSHWTQWLEIEGVMELAAYPNHDLVLARRSN